MTTLEKLEGALAEATDPTVRELLNEKIKALRKKANGRVAVLKDGTRVTAGSTIYVAEPPNAYSRGGCTNLRPGAVRAETVIAVTPKGDQVAFREDAWRGRPNYETIKGTFFGTYADAELAVGQFLAREIDSQELVKAEAQRCLDALRSLAGQPPISLKGNDRAPYATVRAEEGSVA